MLTNMKEETIKGENRESQRKIYLMKNSEEVTSVLQRAQSDKYGQ